MSEVEINPEAISRFLHSESGPLARLVRRKAREIEALARDNLAPHHRSGDAEAGMQVTEIRQADDSIYVLVGTDARHPWRGHEPFNYPIALELGGVTPSGADFHYPFLAPALISAGFRPGAG